MYASFFSGRAQRQVVFQQRRIADKLARDLRKQLRQKNLSRAEKLRAKTEEAVEDLKGELFHDMLGEDA